MLGRVSFRGRSGKAWEFYRTPSGSPWARERGVVIFAARETCGWRVYRVLEISGRPHDVQPIWALAEAERYGADTVFLAWEPDEARRQMIITDLEAAFTSVCRHTATLAGGINRIAA